MGQITEDFIQRAMRCCQLGQHPYLTVWETRQLLTAWVEWQGCRDERDKLDEANRICEQWRQWTVATRAENEALRARVAELESMNKMLCGKLDDQRRALWDPCAPYLKDGETPAQCIVRNRRDVDTAMASMVRDRDDALRYRWLRIVDGNQWGVLGLTDPDGLDAAIDAARATSNKPAPLPEGT